MQRSLVWSAALGAVARIVIPALVVLSCASSETGGGAAGGGSGGSGNASGTGGSGGGSGGKPPRALLAVAVHDVEGATLAEFDGTAWKRSELATERAILPAPAVAADDAGGALIVLAGAGKTLRFTRWHPGGGFGSVASVPQATDVEPEGELGLIFRNGLYFAVYATVSNGVTALSYDPVGETWNPPVRLVDGYALSFVSPAAKAPGQFVLTFASAGASLYEHAFPAVAQPPEWVSPTPIGAGSVQDRPTSVVAHRPNGDAAQVTFAYDRKYASALDVFVDGELSTQLSGDAPMAARVEPQSGAITVMTRFHTDPTLWKLHVALTDVGIQAQPSAQTAVPVLWYPHLLDGVGGDATALVGVHVGRERAEIYRNAEGEPEVIGPAHTCGAAVSW